MRHKYAQGNRIHPSHITGNHTLLSILKTGATIQFPDGTYLSGRPDLALGEAGRRNEKDALTHHTTFPLHKWGLIETLRWLGAIRRELADE